jgi:hypothetical protein
MRLSDILGRLVVDRDGQRVGTVADLRLEQDGPVAGPYGPSFRVAGLVVVERRHLRLLGYQRAVGPKLLRAVVRRVAGGVTFIPWDDVADPLDPVTLTLRSAARDLRPLEEIDT